MASEFGPCESWTPIWTCDVSAQSPTATGYAAGAATRIVWALSGRQYGTCEVTLRPCRRECYDSVWWSAYGPPWTAVDSWYSGQWFPSGCGGCVSDCSCTSLSEVVLPSPVSSIVSVKLDGVAVTGIHRVDNNRLLVRTDGSAWPSCQDMTKADTEAGTWSVTALIGQDVPVSGQLAVGALACEILKAMAGQDCALPSGVRTVVRQGVTLELADANELLTNNRTGIQLVDLFLAAENPDNLRQRGRVYSVTRPTVRRAGT